MLAFSKCHIGSRGAFRKHVTSWGRDSAPSSSTIKGDHCGHTQI